MLDWSSSHHCVAVGFRAGRFRSHEKRPGQSPAATRFGETVQGVSQGSSASSALAGFERGVGFFCAAS